MKLWVLISQPVNPSWIKSSAMMMIRQILRLLLVSGGGRRILDEQATQIIRRSIASSDERCWTMRCAGTLESFAMSLLLLETGAERFTSYRRFPFPVSQRKIVLLDRARGSPISNQCRKMNAVHCSSAGRSRQEESRRFAAVSKMFCEGASANSLSLTQEVGARRWKV